MTSGNSAMVYSRDIEDNPIKVTNQGGNVSFTCTRVADRLLSPVWRLMSFYSPSTERVLYNIEN